MKEYIRYFAADQGAPFCIEIAGKSWCDGSYRIYRERSPIWVLEYIEAGRGTVEIRGQKYTPQTGDVYLLPAGARQLYFSDAREPWIKIFVNCRGAVVDGLADAYGLGGRILYQNVERETADCFRELNALMEDREMPDEQILHRAELIIHDIFRRLGQMSREEKEKCREMRRVKHYLDTHVAELVSIGEMAALIYRSPDYLIRHFKEETGLTPYQYLLKRKLQVAANLLRDTTLSVGEIAMQLGYEDAHYFSGLFKKETGVPPRQYRKDYHCMK